MRGVLEAYRRVLRNRPLTKLLLGEFVSSIGDWLYLVALLIILYKTSEDAVLLGVVGAARVLPYVFLSIPAGIVADRFDRRMVLLVTDLARGALMLVLAWLAATGGAIEAIVAVTILATCFSAFFGPAIGAYLPNLAADEADLGPANSTYAMLENVAFIIGPAVAALILAFSDLTIAFLLNAVSFVVIAGVLWTLPPSRAGRAHSTIEPADPAAAGQEVDASVDATLDTAAAGTGAGDAPATGAFHWRGVAVPISALMVFDLVESFIFGGIGVLTVIIAFELLGAGEEGTGALNAAVGIGGLVGAVVSGTLVLRRRLAPPLLLGAAVMGGSVAVLGQSGSLPLAMVAMGASATGSLLVGIVGETLFQRIVPDAVRGRAIGLLETLSVLFYAAGSLLMPLLADSLGLGPVLLVSGIAIVLAGGVAVVFLGSWAVQTPPEDATRATLAGVPIFAGLPPARLEIAERRSAVVSMAAGTVIIRQGDVADRFYVIADGEVEVTQTPRGGGVARILRRMGRGEVFGEIGLLTGGARTATVTAISAGTLVALDKPDFLALVGGGSGLTFPLLDLHRGASQVGG
jgi:MFS family permease